MRAPEISPPHLIYRDLMRNIRTRYEIIRNLNLKEESEFASYETAAFHLRKMIEGIAFGCLVAFDQAFKKVPRDAVGQWNADNIFARLQKKEQVVFPASFTREDPKGGLQPAVQHHLVLNDAANLTIDEVRNVYRRTHKWLHEWNPYIVRLGNDLEKSKCELLEDISKIWDWIVQHKIGIGGHIFLGLLEDSSEGQVRVLAAESVGQ